jgi:hypothetical protein
VSHENPVSTILRHRAPEVKKANVAYGFKSLNHGLDCKVMLKTTVSAECRWVQYRPRIEIATVLPVCCTQRDFVMRWTWRLWSVLRRTLSLGCDAQSEWKTDTPRRGKLL